MKLFSTTLFISIICVISSCNHQQQEANLILRNVGILLTENPDSALFYLESIAAPEELRRQQYYDYHLLLIQAKDKNRQNISNETFIFELKDYYQNKEPEKAALASFYCGKILYLNKDYENAMTYFLEAEDLISLIDNLQTKGLIQFWMGRLLYDQILTTESIERFKEAENYFRKAESYNNLMSTYNQIGNAFVSQKNMDSAFVYYDKCIEIADKYTSNNQSAIRNNIGFACLKMENIEKARFYFTEALNLSESNLDKGTTNFHLARTYLIENKLDSFDVYLNETLKLINTLEHSPLNVSVYKTLYMMEESNKNYEKAIEYYNKYIENLDKIFQSNKRDAILEIEKKYDYQKLQNKSMAKIISQQSINQTLLSILIIVLITAGYWIYRYMKNAKELLEAKNNIRELILLSKRGADQNNNMRSLLLESFDIFTKIATLEDYLKEEEKKQGGEVLKKVNEIVYKDNSLKWEKLFDTVNAVYDKLLYKLQQDYPELEITDIKLCCLSLGDLSNTEISLIMKFHPTTIQSKKSQLRKKLNIKPQGDIRKYLLEKYDCLNT